MNNNSTSTIVLCSDTITTTSATMSSEVAPSIPNWWKVCFVYGDQTKYYRKLYGKKSHVRNLKSYTAGLPVNPAAAALGAAEKDADADSM